MSTANTDDKKFEPRKTFCEEYDRHVECTWCKSKNTHVSSPFGGTVSEILYQCDDCKGVFGWMKWEHKKPR